MGQFAQVSLTSETGEGPFLMLGLHKVNDDQ